MAYGRLTLEQELALTPHIQGSLVHDLGAGDLILAADLLRLGAKQVVAIDKNPYRKKAPQGITPVTCYFEAYPSPIDIAFMSWPQNTFDAGLLNICRRARIVVYLGRNTGGQACSFSTLSQHLATRQVLAHAPDEYNSLIIYSSVLEPRRYLPEEYAAIFQDKMWDHRELQAIADTLPMVGTPTLLFGN
jgi:hypothetical protein